MLFAVSSITRQNEPAQLQLVHAGGLDIILAVRHSLFPLFPSFIRS